MNKWQHTQKHFASYRYNMMRTHTHTHSHTHSHTYTNTERENDASHTVAVGKKQSIKGTVRQFGMHASSLLVTLQANLHECV